MNRDERLNSYIESLEQPLPGYLSDLYERAREHDIPVIRPAMTDLIRTLLYMLKPMTILEVGTAIGFSALYMREYAPEGCRITTIEDYAPRITAARENLAEYDPDGRITLIEGDAVRILADMDGRFDFIFMDGPKAQYITMYDDVKRLLVPGGILLSDNILQEGDILESRYAVSRRDRTIHTRMREYLYRLMHDDDYSTSILNTGDGAALSVLKEFNTAPQSS